jgi:hypothetical protein
VGVKFSFPDGSLGSKIGYMSSLVSSLSDDSLLFVAGLPIRRARKDIVEMAVYGMEEV